MKTRNYYWNEQLVLCGVGRDGVLCIRMEYNQSDKPIKTVLYWPVAIDMGQVCRIDRATLPLPAHRACDGTYTVRLEADLDKPQCGYDAHATVYLPQGGQTKAIAVENLDIPNMTRLSA